MTIPVFFSSLELSYLSSRVHPLRTFNGQGWKGFVKRDDELSFGISGCKTRKYASLLPFLEKKGMEEVAVIGGAFSNHVLGISQRLIEKGMRPTLFLRGEETALRKGNFLLTSLLVSSKSIHWISRKEWPNVEVIAANYCESQRQKGVKAFMLPEGGLVEASLIGALTLGWDILNNESNQDIYFNHIFIDSGTGLSAIGLLLYLGWIKRNISVHIVLIAGTDEDFEKQLLRFKNAFERMTGETISEFPPYFTYQMTVCRSFGTVTRGIIEVVGEMARNEGFFVDPIYSAKLFMESKKIIKEKELAGNILFVHSGGALTLSGFQDKLVTA